MAVAGTDRTVGPDAAARRSVEGVRFLRKAFPEGGPTYIQAGGDMVVTHFGRTGMALAAILFGATACGGNDGAADTAGSDTGAVQSAGGDVAGSNMASPAMVMAFRATVDQAEIEAGQLAQGKATNAQVKQFARMIVTDHRRAHAMADSASGMAGTAGTGTAGTGAAAAGGQPVADLMAMHQQAMTALQNAAKGRVFDSTYVALMIAGHQDVLSRLEGMRGASGSVAGTGAGATAAGGALSGTGGTGAGGQMQLESWSETIRTHLARAQELQRTIQGATR